MSKVLLADPFETSEFSIAWAKDHITELDREIDTFLNDDDARTIVTEPSVNGTYHLLKIKFLKPMPRPLRGHASDAAINLRNALDQAMFAVAGSHGYFPIRDSKSAFDDAMRDVSKRIPNEIADIVRNSEPYKGRNDLLWALNRLVNTKKHGILRPVTSANTLKIEGFALGILFWNPPRWDSDKNEMILARIPTGTNFDIDLEATFFITFNEIESLDGKEVLTVLNEFVNIVEGIVMAIKAESKRIGIF